MDSLETVNVRLYTEGRGGGSAQLVSEGTLIPKDVFTNSN